MKYCIEIKLKTFIYPELEKFKGTSSEAPFRLLYIQYI